MSSQFVVFVVSGAIASSLIGCGGGTSQPPMPPAPAPPAPTPPVFAPSCQHGNHGWPKFDDVQSLYASPWGRYFELVYGSVPSFGYPICIFDFWYLDEDKVTAANITDKASVGKCPSQEGDHFSGGIGWQSPQSGWIWHPGPYSAQNSTWVEVTHQQSPHESGGAWFMRAPGSGIWVNLGTTRSYEEHADMQKEFSDCHCYDCEYPFQALCRCANKHGIDSLQFLAHDDPEWDCPEIIPRPLNIEIVMCQLDGTYACGGKSDAFRAGWMASEVCNCDENLHFANCNGNVSEIAAPLNEVHRTAVEFIATV